jgi:Na+/alanine symporter
MLKHSSLIPSKTVSDFVDVSLPQVITARINRNVLSNEIGLGNAPITHGTDQVRPGIRPNKF